jgi:hypothetical protein
MSFSETWDFLAPAKTLILGSWLDFGLSPWLIFSNFALTLLEETEAAFPLGLKFLKSLEASKFIFACFSCGSIWLLLILLMSKLFISKSLILLNFCSWFGLAFSSIDWSEGFICSKGLWSFKLSKSETFSFALGWI